MQIPQTVPMTAARVFLFLAIAAGCAEAQAVKMFDSVFTNISYGENFQNIEFEPVADTNAFDLYTVFDLNTHAVVNVYRTTDHRRTKDLKLVRSFTLPYGYRHPGGVSLYGNSLIVLGVNNGPVSYLGRFNKYTGTLLREYIDTLSGDWLVTTCYVHKDTVYRIISDTKNVEVQRFGVNGFITIFRLQPPPQRDKFNYIQGATVIKNRILAVMTSSPTRMDLFDLDRNFEYLGRMFGEDNGLESQGITSYESADSVYIYYGLRFPNKINVSFFAKQLPAPVLLFPEDKSLFTNSSISFAWKYVEGAFYYAVNVATDSLFTKVVRYDTILVNPQYINELTNSGRYFWRARGYNIFDLGDWSVPRTVRFDILVDQPSGTPVPPSVFSVGQNFPNPFNGSTTIAYDLPKTSDVTLDLYDIAGSHLERIRVGPRPAGHHQYTVRMDPYVSGTYFCTVRTGLGSKVIKFLHLK